MPDFSELKAIFFDLDDTLVFSEHAHKKAWQILLTNLGVDSSVIDFRRLVGMPEIVEATHFIDYFGIHESVASMVARKREIFLMLSEQGFESAIGRNNFLKRISASYITAIVSASSTRIIQQVLKVEKITSFFNFVIGHEDCIRPKPDPFPYQHALALANVQAHEALVIEDSFTGITAALGAHIPVFGLLKDQLPEQMIKNVPYFNNFDEINKKLFES